MFTHLIILTLITFASLANAQNIARIKNLNGTIYKLDKEIKSAHQIIASISENISQTNYLLSQKRQNLIGENSQFNVTVREIARMARHPKQAQLINDIITQQPPKNGVIIQGQKKLAGNLRQQQTEITSLLKIYAQNQKLLEKKSASITSLTKKRTQLHIYQRKLLKSLNISDSKLRKRLTVNRLKTPPLADDLPSDFQNPRPFKGDVPVAGLITQTFGEKNAKGTLAFGTSFLTTPNAKVKAITGGVVLFNSNYKDYGNMLIIADNAGRKHLYSGLETSNLEVGSIVKAQSPVGFLPNTPEPILYYELRQHGEAQKPEI